MKKFANAQGSRCSERALIEQKKLDAAAQPLFASLNEQQKLVPESAWEDRDGKPYVPARYGACFWGVEIPPKVEARLDLLPASAQALLRGSDRVAENPRCFEVTPETARSLEEILSEARPSAGDLVLREWEVGAWRLRDGNRVFITLRPLFPDGRILFQPPW